MIVKPGLTKTTVEFEDKDIAKLFAFVSNNPAEQKAAIGAVVSQLIDSAKTELDDQDNVKAAANAMDFIITQGFGSLMKVLEDNPDFLQPFVEQVLPQIIIKVGETLAEMEEAPKAAISDFLGDVIGKARTYETRTAEAQTDVGAQPPEVG